MGILNVTPDSFSDGGRWASVEQAVAAGEAMWAAGADLVDVGGESTRPGAEVVGPDEERERVIPVIARLAEQGIAVSVDTRRSEVASAAVAAGARVVNDVSGGEDPRMADVVASTGVVWILMHMRGTPQTMQRDTRYDDLLGEVEASLKAALSQARARGVAAERLWVDPGVGFGKDAEGNTRLIAGTPRWTALAPTLIGASRKSFLGALTGVLDPSARDAASIGAALAAAMAGAAWLRVHDVPGTIQALQAFYACR